MFNYFFEPEFPNGNIFLRASGHMLTAAANEHFVFLPGLRGKIWGLGHQSETRCNGDDAPNKVD